MSDDVTRLAKFLGMMGSDHDGEVLNAARMAERHRKAMNKSWLVLLSSTGGSSDDRFFMRALRAEAAVAMLQDRVTVLERELAAMRTARYNPSSSPRPRPASSRSSGKYDLPRASEDNLADALLADWRTSDEVYSLTRWPRAHLRVVLGRIAKRRRVSLEVRTRFGEMQYRFLPL
jgi:hypothetical protein